jgi:hypothetical protein
MELEIREMNKAQRIREKELEGYDGTFENPTMLR